MKIIDAHMHFSNIQSFQDSAEKASLVGCSPSDYARQAAAAGVVKSICMGVTETAPGLFPDNLAQTPMPGNLCGSEPDSLPDKIYLCPGINPHTLDKENLGKLESWMRDNPRVVGVKLYPGYYHFDVFDPVYEPVYALAEKYGLPVAIHTGDTWSDRALLSYAHPLNVDRAAVTHPKVKLVICHIGAPWCLDACEVVFKNKNVFADLSGLAVGCADDIRRVSENPVFLDRYRNALQWCGDYSKFLFGTDWPLCPYPEYIEFVKKLIPGDAIENVFYKNGLRVYSRLAL